MQRVEGGNGVFFKKGRLFKGRPHGEGTQLAAEKCGNPPSLRQKAAVELPSSIRGLEEDHDIFRLT